MHGQDRMAGLQQPINHEPAGVFDDHGELVSILLGGIKTRAPWRPWEESGGYPFTGQVVPGMKATRARSAAFTRNVGGHAPILLLAGVRRREGARASGENREALSTVAGRAVGPARSSDETPVTGGMCDRGGAVTPYQADDLPLLAVPLLWVAHGRPGDHGL
jgi:hypothetical protein